MPTLLISLRKRWWGKTYHTLLVTSMLLHYEKSSITRHQICNPVFLCGVTKISYLLQKGTLSFNQQLLRTSIPRWSPCLSEQHTKLLLTLPSQMLMLDMLRVEGLKGESKSLLESTLNSRRHVGPHASWQTLALGRWGPQAPLTTIFLKISFDLKTLKKYSSKIYLKKFLRIFFTN